MRKRKWEEIRLKRVTLKCFRVSRTDILIKKAKTKLVALAQKSLSKRVTKIIAHSNKELHKQYGLLDACNLRSLN